MKIPNLKNRQIWVNFSVGFLASFSTTLAMSAIQGSKIGYETIIRALIFALFLTILVLLVSNQTPHRKDKQ